MDPNWGDTWPHNITVEDFTEPEAAFFARMKAHYAAVKERSDQGLPGPVPPTWHYDPADRTTLTTLHTWESDAALLECYYLQNGKFVLDDDLHKRWWSSRDWLSVSLRQAIARLAAQAAGIDLGADEAPGYL